MRSHFWPFTDVLGRIWRLVTPKDASRRRIVEASTRWSGATTDCPPSPHSYDRPAADVTDRDCSGSRGSPAEDRRRRVGCFGTDAGGTPIRLRSGQALPLQRLLRH